VLKGLLLGSLLLCADTGIVLVELQGPAGQHIYVNPQEVASVREPRGVDTGHWAKGVKCLVVMANGRFLTVVETCEQVRQILLTGDPKPPSAPQS
jgi:hypothetical protein